MSTIAIEFSSEQIQRLNTVAARRSVTVEELVRQLADEGTTRDEAVESASQYVLKKNADLYRRLA